MDFAAAGCILVAFQKLNEFFSDNVQTLWGSNLCTPIWIGQRSGFAIFTMLQHTYLFYGDRKKWLGIHGH